MGVVLIPGASGGFGRVLATTLAKRGERVFGTMREPDGSGDGFELLPMEVTDPASVERCVARVLESEGRIDALVYCVNQMFIGTIEEQSVEEVRSLYDTNVFGMLRVCQAVIPAMRRQGQGTLVAMSSLGGLLAVPTMSAYTSAKFALEAMSEAMYHELRPQGIDVVILQPVAMAMDRPATGAHLHTVAGAAEGSPSLRMVERMAKDTAASKLTPQQVADKVHEVLKRPPGRKPLRVPMDRARPLGLVKRLAPQAVIDRIIGGLMKEIGADRRS